MADLEHKTETNLRILACELIQTAGILLNLNQLVMVTGKILFQRYFYSKPFTPKYIVYTAMTCIYLASKIEKDARNIRDVIPAFYHIKQTRENENISPPLVWDDEYSKLEYKVIRWERKILSELGYWVNTKHPHELIIINLQILGYDKDDNIMKVIWKFSNDSLNSPMCIQFSSETLICSCEDVTSCTFNKPLPESTPQYGNFKVSENNIENVCYRIMALYKQPKPNVEKLDEAVTLIRRKYIPNTPDFKINKYLKSNKSQRIFKKSHIDDDRQSTTSSCDRIFSNEICSTDHKSNDRFSPKYYENTSNLISEYLCCDCEYRISCQNCNMQSSLSKFNSNRIGQHY